MATYTGLDKRLAYLFVNGGGGGGASALVDLSDVSISSPTDGQVLIYDANNDVWVNSSAGNPSSLASLSDVTITSPTTGQVLTYNGTDWINATGGGSSSHTYSTTEQVVGTWIDGKPIYEKTVTTSVTNPTTNTLINLEDVSSLAIDSVCDIRGVAHTDYGTTFNRWLAEGIYLIFQVNVATGYLVMVQSYSSYGTWDISVTIKYTKTTD